MSGRSADRCRETVSPQFLDGEFLDVFALDVLHRAAAALPGPFAPVWGDPKGAEGSLPEEAEETLEDRRSVPVDPPGFFDHGGAEFVFVASTPKPEKKLGIELETDDEDLDSADIIMNFKMERELHPMEPLTKGRWA
ncbi:MAG: hypothetical protein KY455_00655 [Euryarchaeota archaeon]|nr:hypothetical protein [Euryarchaeota archaeon]